MTTVPRHELDLLLERAFAEDLGLAGDITSNSIIPSEVQASFVIAARQQGVIAGLDAAAAAFAYFDPALVVAKTVEDGAAVAPGDQLATISGRARSILTAERVALNLLGHLSGVATATAELVEAIAGTGAHIVCTRKTTPGLRSLEKGAVRSGGGSNHRFSLADAVLIKDNHLAVAGSVTKAVDLARAGVGHLVKIEVEVDNLEQLAELLEVGADVVLLDNMDPAQLAEAVKMVDGAMITEASGGITLDTARAKAEAGVDLLSVGWITHSAPSLDVGLDEIL